MRKMSRHVFQTSAVCCLFLLIVLAAPPSAAVSSAVDAGARIDIYEQYGLESGHSDTGSPKDYRYGHAPFLLTGGRTDVTGHVGKSDWYGKPNCLAQGGCCLFAHAHAIEWVLGRHMGDDLLLDLLSRCESPSNAYGHNYPNCRHTGKSYDAYTAFARTLGITARVNRLGLGRTALRKGFCDGIVYVAALPDGSHYVCAVDYVIADANGNIIEDDGVSPIPSGCAFYIQIVDSVPYASALGSGRFGGRIYQFGADGRLALRTAQFSMYYGGAYFVKTDTLTVCSELSMPSSWPGHLRKNRVCAVTFDARGGINAPDRQDFLWGEEAAIADVTPSRLGYRFIGWAFDACAQAADLAPGQACAFESDTTLYALWSPVSVLTLPGGLKRLEEEAFAGTNAACAVCPGSLEAIGPRAFADCASLTQILIPESVAAIDETAFDGCGPGVEIWGAPGSAAADFADGHPGFVFIAIE